ncbi:hypothetical protein [Azohydromonas australica]|uniref:hypothetical protein n=1 Tax=Azohydromonas australica TaxID=364039 RepID=UPI0004030B6D|nr:hypothetical protein [Azohydromonas australica]
MTQIRNTPSSTPPAGSAGSRGGSISSSQAEHTGLADGQPGDTPTGREARPGTDGPTSQGLAGAQGSGGGADRGMQQDPGAGTGSGADRRSDRP